MVIHLVNKREDKILKFYISGGQGSGKSTVSKFIKFYLKNYFNYNVASLSLDDIYLSKKDRVALSSKIHPLLITRWVPGTHNVDQGIKIIKKLVPSIIQEMNPSIIETIKFLGFTEMLDSQKIKLHIKTILGLV